MRAQYIDLAERFKSEGENRKAENLRQFAKVVGIQITHLERCLAAAADTTVDLYVCQVCGFIARDAAPDNCPVCNAIKAKFEKFA